jgi:hypothetical protein
LQAGARISRRKMQQEMWERRTSGNAEEKDVFGRNYVANASRYVGQCSNCLHDGSCVFVCFDEIHNDSYCKVVIDLLLFPNSCEQIPQLEYGAPDYEQYGEVCGSEGPAGGEWAC